MFRQLRNDKYRKLILKLRKRERVRAFIRFLNFQNVSSTEIHQKVIKVTYTLSIREMSEKSVSVCCIKFNSDEESVEDQKRFDKHARHSRSKDCCDQIDGSNVRK